MTELFKANLLEGAPHGFTGARLGNMGLGAGDEPEAVARNRALAAEAVLQGGKLVGVYQTHSADCVVVDSAWGDDARPEADALVTAQRELVLGIVTADCAPVLLADIDAGVIGAAHAGWKGALAGVTDNTIAAMEQLGARRKSIRAAIGPCIAQASYEVDDGFRARFVAVDGGNDRFFASGAPHHFQFDLEGYVAHRLAAAGIGKIESLRLDTYPDAARFYSFRRATHRGEASYGRQISLIGLA